MMPLSFHLHAARLWVAGLLERVGIAVLLVLFGFRKRGRP
jgi:hypothetical protein